MSCEHVQFRNNSDAPFFSTEFLNKYFKRRTTMQIKFRISLSGELKLMGWICAVKKMLALWI